MAAPRPAILRATETERRREKERVGGTVWKVTNSSRQSGQKRKSKSTSCVLLFAKLLSAKIFIILVSVAFNYNCCGKLHRFFCSPTLLSLKPLNKVQQTSSRTGGSSFKSCWSVPGLAVNCIFTPNCNADENANASHGIAWHRIQHSQSLANGSSTSSSAAVVATASSLSSSSSSSWWALSLALTGPFFFGGSPFMPETFGVCFGASLSSFLPLSVALTPSLSVSVCSSAGQWIALIRFHFMTIISTMPCSQTHTHRGYAQPGEFEACTEPALAKLICMIFGCIFPSLSLPFSLCSFIRRAWKKTNNRWVLPAKFVYWLSLCDLSRSWKRKMKKWKLQGKLVEILSKFCMF